MRKSQVYDFCFLFNQMSVFFLKIACHAKMIPIVYTAIGDVAKLVDALDLGSSAARCESSSLSVPTINHVNSHGLKGNRGLV